MMYDELIKRLRVSCESCKLWDGYKCCLKGECSAQKSLQAADAIEELVEERDMYIKAMADEHNRAARLAWEHRWISVTERLPTEHGHYLTSCSVTRDGETTSWMQLDFFVNGKFLEDDVGNPKVTHWMPLPQPPESEETNG